MFYYLRAASFGDASAISTLSSVFKPDCSPGITLGYKANNELHEVYEKLYAQVRDNPVLRFPNLANERSLPPHPEQGLDAEHPDRRFAL